MSLFEFANSWPIQVWLLIGLSGTFIIGLYLCEDWSMSAYELGMKAYFDGQDKNPYNPYSQEYDDWSEGWADAAKDNK